MQIYHKFGDLSILFAISIKIHAGRPSPIIMKCTPACGAQHDRHCEDPWRRGNLIWFGMTMWGLPRPDKSGLAMTDVGWVECNETHHIRWIARSSRAMTGDGLRR